MTIDPAGSRAQTILANCKRVPLEILFVEDHPGDALLVGECFRRASCAVNLSHVKHGEECMAFLEKMEPYANAPNPQLLLVDLYMPVMSGHELIEALLEDWRFRHLPIVILTTEADEYWVREMYALRCNSYIVKPWSLEELQDVVKMICRYWIGVATLPVPAPLP